MKKSRLIFARYSQSRRTERRKQMVMGASAGLCGLLVAASVIGTKHDDWLSQLIGWRPFLNSSATIQEKWANTKVLSLVSLPASERAEQLEAIAHGPNSIERSRARYMLASDLIEQQQGQKALSLLAGLEWNYGVMSPYIALKRAQAYEVIGDKAKAQAAWKDVLMYHSDSPAAAEALYALNKMNPRDWETMLSKYPSHPRTLEMARYSISQNPKQPQLMLMLAKYAFDSPEITPVLDRLVSQLSILGEKSKEFFKQEDWEAIALGYWLNRKYGQASAAYAKAPHTPKNAYRVARGLQLAEKRGEANQAYKQMVAEFPNAKETASALLHIAKLEPIIEAVPYLDEVISKFPDRAGEALILEAQVLDKLKSTQPAREARQLLVTKYGNSDAAAEYRWQMAQKKAAAGDIQAALQWAQPITTQNPHSELSRVAAFWVGKWSKLQGQHEVARASFEEVLKQHPQSYYAWRSAALLGLDVGDFSTVRKITPSLEPPAERPELPIGSAMLKELYKLGQDQDAWTVWQAEFQNRINPTVPEQFTDGLLRLGAGDYMKGISQISSLEDRDTPQEQAQYQSLKQQAAYWQALYPIPYKETIQTWSKKRQLNPLLVSALIRQESRFMPNIRSSAGAVGLMQVMPHIAALVAKQINLKEYALDDPNDNVNLGTWLLDSTSRQYRNNALLAVASYNAGSGNVGKWLREQEYRDPDEFVENIPFSETRNYVRQVFGNYWNYLRLYNPEVGQQVANYSSGQLTTLLNRSQRSEVRNQKLF